MTATITPLPPAPSRGDDSTTFSNKADALLGALDQFVTEANLLITSADQDAIIAAAAAITASNQATVATSAATTALLNTAIPRWVSGTTYAADDTVISPTTNLTYRRRSAGAGTTDPSADVTNWAAVVTVSHTVTARGGAYTLVAADRAGIQACTVALTLSVTSASTLGNGWFAFITNDATTGVVTITPNGVETVNGAANLVLGTGACGLLVSNGTNLRFFSFTSPVTTGVATLASASNLDVRYTSGDIVHVTGSGVISTITILTGQRKTLIFNSGGNTLLASIKGPYGCDISPGQGDSYVVVGDSFSTAVIVSGSNLQRPYFHARDEKTANTAGGASAAGDNTRALQTVVTNTIFGASLASNVITLSAGTYYIRASAPVSGAVGAHRLSLYNNTDSAVALYGVSATTSAGTMVDTVEGKLVITAQKAFILRQRITSVVATSGLGSPVNDGNPEVYASVQIWKEST